MRHIFIIAFIISAFSFAGCKKCQDCRQKYTLYSGEKGYSSSYGTHEFCGDVLKNVEGTSGTYTDLSGQAIGDYEIVCN